MKFKVRELVCCNRPVRKFVTKDKNGHVQHVGRECEVCGRVVVDVPFHLETEDEKKAFKQKLIDKYYNVNLRFVN